MKKKLVGKFFLVNDDANEHYRTGEVAAQVTSDHYLMQYDNMGGGDIQFGSEVVDVDEMTTVCKHCDAKRWSFFDSREKLETFLNWLDTPPAESKTPKVVPLKKK